MENTDLISSITHNITNIYDNDVLKTIPDVLRVSEDVPKCSSFNDSIKWMNSEGIKSKIAMFNILSACESKTYTTSLKDGASRWLQEIILLNPIHTRAMALYNENIEQDTFFALHTLYYLQFGRYAWDNISSVDNEAPTCPYGDNAKNFILTLLKTNTCLCTCYTQYVLAACEEFNHDLVVGCHLPGHINIVIVYPENKDLELLTRDDCIKSIFPLKYKHNICIDPNFKFDINLISQPTIYATFDAGFKNNFYLKITTKLTVNNFREKYVKNMTMNLKINLQTNRDKFPCESLFKMQTSQWNNIHMIMNAIGYRKTQTQQRYTKDIMSMNAIWGNHFVHLIPYRAFLHGKDKRNIDKAQKYIQRIIVDLQKFSVKLGVYPLPDTVKAILESAATCINNKEGKCVK